MSNTFKDKLDEVLEPAFTDGKGVVYSLRLDEARQQILEAIEEVVGKTRNIYLTKDMVANGDYGDDVAKHWDSIRRQILDDFGITKGGADE